VAERRFGKAEVMSSSLIGGSILDMKANIITELGPVEIDLADYPSLSQIWSTQEVGRAKPLDCVNTPSHPEEGGFFDFNSVKPIDFFRKIHQ